MVDVAVIEANLGHADGPAAVRDRLGELLPRHGRWVVLACEAHQLWGTPYAPKNGVIHQAVFAPPPAPQNWHNRSRGKAEVAVITGPDVHVDHFEWVKVMDGPARPSKYQHDRWLLLVWATVDGERFLFISGHFQANVARGGVTINPMSAAARDYRAGVEKTCQVVVDARAKGYRPVFGCDLNHRRISIPPWDGNPHKQLKAAGMAVRSHKIDALATDAATIRWTQNIDVTHPAEGCDHDWLRGRLTTEETYMPRRPDYPPADANTQWFADNPALAGSKIDPNVLVIHTTEGTTWPPYDNNGDGVPGDSAPNYTARPNARRLLWRQHYPETMSSRALRNEDGGVETNTLNCVQVELIGTCSPATRDKWVRDGLKQITDDQAGDFIFWPAAPDWALRELATFIADIHKRRPEVKLRAPELWLAYGVDERAPGRVPASYGDSPARFSFATWRRFKGVCGHQHVPENVHGDPGRLNIEKVLRYATALAYPTPPEPDNHVTAGRDLIRQGLRELAKANPDRAAVAQMAAAIKAALDAGPES